MYLQTGEYRYIKQMICWIVFGLHAEFMYNLIIAQFIY